jgi:hypothetical protein
MRTANIFKYLRASKDTFTIVKSSCFFHGLRTQIDQKGSLKVESNDQMFERDFPKQHLYVLCCVQLLL